MAFTPTALSAASDAIKALAGFVSLHTADPGLTGTAEATGGSYVRKAVTWGASSDGDTAGSQVTWTCGTDLAAGTYTHAGYWSASSAGTYYGGNALSASKTVASGDQLKYTPTIDVD